MFEAVSTARRGDCRVGKSTNNPPFTFPPQHPMTIDVLPSGKKGTWARCFDKIEQKLKLVDEEWWAAVP